MTPKERAAALYADGFGCARIAKELGVSKSTIQRWVIPGEKERDRARALKWKDDNRARNRERDRKFRLRTEMPYDRFLRKFRHQRRRALVERLWAEGLTAREIGEELGQKPVNTSVLRTLGYDLPHRRTPEQIARITADSGAHLAKARAARGGLSKIAL
jgi:transposase